jgi:TRAP-type mannitol/chloroaromatic compound transport system permease small subunit
MKALATFVAGVDRVNDVVGRGVSWLTLAMVLITFGVVVLRYVFSVGFVWMQESYVWLHGVVFMAGAGYTLLHNGHVRVDIFYRPGSPRFKAWVNLCGSMALIMPLVVMVFWVTWPYVLSSWSRLEQSREAGGLPGLFLLKTVILVFGVLIGLQGLSLAGRSLLVLTGHWKAEEEVSHLQTQAGDA